MGKKKGKKSEKGLVQVKQVPAEVILSHPVFRDMAARLETMQKVLQTLPQAIGQAVAEATRRPPEGASGPAMSLVDVREVEISPRRLKVDGQEFGVKRLPPRQVILEFASTGGFATAGVIRLSKEAVTLKPIQKVDGLDMKECVWSLSTGQRTPAEPDDGWRISKFDLEVLVKCAAEK